MTWKWEIVTANPEDISTVCMTAMLTAAHQQFHWKFLTCLLHFTSILICQCCLQWWTEKSKQLICMVLVQQSVSPSPTAQVHHLPLANLMAVEKLFIAEVENNSHNAWTCCICWGISNKGKWKRGMNVQHREMKRGLREEGWKEKKKEGE